jgi:hypothetical protein
MLKQNSLSVERFLHFSDTQLPILRGKKQAGDYLYSKQDIGLFTETFPLKKDQELDPNEH